MPTPEQDTTETEKMPRRPEGDVGQGARETVPVEDDPAALADAVIRARGY